jgi:hypothetical protein
MYGKNSNPSSGLGQLSNSIIFEEHFKSLSYEPLRLRARRWAEKTYHEAPISRIILYNFSSEFAYLLGQGGRFSGDNREPFPKYVIVFEIDADNDLREMGNKEEREYQKKFVRGQTQGNPWDKLLNHIRCRGRGAFAPSYPQLLQPDFCNVYKNPPSEVPSHEWRFEAKFRNTQVTSSVRNEAWEPCAVLYSSLPTGDDIDDFIRRAHPQAVDLYKAVLEKIDLNNPAEVDQEAAKDFALDEIDSNRSHYDLIPKSALLSKVFDPGGERKASRLQWKILQTVIQNKFGKKMSIEKIKGRYKALQRALDK